MYLEELNVLDKYLLNFVAHAKTEGFVFVLYCIDGVVIAAQCIATLSLSIVLPRI